MIPNSTSTLQVDHTRGHACFCIGCCTKCGQCRTHPRHTVTCDRIAELNAEKRRILRGDA